MFNDDDIYPFLGEHRGKRLLSISTEYWQEFLESLADFIKSDEYVQQNMLGRLIAYAKRRVKIPKIRQPRDMGLIRGKICINNGLIHRYIDVEDEIPEGFVIGSLQNNLNEFRDKVLEGYKAFLKTPEGKKYLSDHFKKINVKSSKNRGVLGKRWITNGEHEMILRPEEEMPEGYKYGRTWNVGAYSLGIKRTEKFKKKVSKGVKRYFKNKKNEETH